MAGEKLIIFDLDGTIVDSAPAFEIAADRIRSRKGLPPIDPSAVRHVLSQPSSPGAEASLLTSTSAGGKELRDALMLFSRYFEEAFRTHAVLFEGMISVLDLIHANHIRAALVSGRLSLFLHQLLYSSDLQDRFDPVVGSDTVGTPPPSADAVEFVLDQVGLQPEDALLVSDGWAELEAGMAAGIKTVWARYGYGREPEFEVDFIIDKPTDLLKYIGLT